MLEMIVKDKSKTNGVGAKAESIRLLSDLGIPVPRTYLIDSEDVLGVYCLTSDIGLFPGFAIPSNVEGVWHFGERNQKRGLV